jgi:acetyltransferase-like isoleucine patch superfamily enzyme
MGGYVKKMKLDASGYIFNHCRWIAYNINRFYYSIFMHILLYFKNISIGESPIFYKKTYFRRCPESVIRIGDNCTFDSAQFRNVIGVNKCCIIATLTERAKLYIGNSSGFSGVRIGCAEHISIGNNCLVGANVTITDTDWHPVDPAERHFKEKGLGQSKPVKIGNNVFLGLNTIVLKGSEIGDNSVIGAGSVVSGIIPPNVIAAGNPCKIIKAL